MGQEAEEVGLAKRALPTSAEQTALLREHADELRECLEHLEDWVEGQVAATRALVSLTVNGRAAGGRPAKPPNGKARAP